MEHRGIAFALWDVGCSYKIRPHWRFHASSKDFLVFFIDSADPSLFDEACELLEWFMDLDALRGAPVLVWANEQDLPGAVTPADIQACVAAVVPATRERRWTCIPLDLDGDGWEAGLDWLVDVL
jgi:signal recognition particle receptor subunit beta